MKLIRTPVDIEEKAFWRLAKLAETRDMRVPEFLAELAVMESANPTKAEHDRIELLWRDRLTDKQIAAALGMTNLAVAIRRRALKLPANKRNDAHGQEASK